MTDGYLSLLYSISEKPLEYWSKQQSPTGRIRKVFDPDLLENVLEINDSEPCNLSKTYITCPANYQQILDIKLPILVIVIKNSSSDFFMKLQVLDTEGIRRRFKFEFSNIEKKNNRNSNNCHVRVFLEPDWNILELDLKSLTYSAFRSNYGSMQKFEITGNCRLRRIYFIDKHYEEFEIKPTFCSNFLDCYMLKWGIYNVNRETQTCAKSSDMNVTNFKATEVMQNNKSNKSSKDCKIGKFIVHSNSDTKEKSFWNNIQSKCEAVIDDFFKRRNSKPFNTMELKRHLIAKPYALQLDAAQYCSSYLSMINKKIETHEKNSLRILKNIKVINDRAIPPPIIIPFATLSQLKGEKKTTNEQKKFTMKYFSHNNQPTMKLMTAEKFKKSNIHKHQFPLQLNNTDTIKTKIRNDIKNPQQLENKIRDERVTNFESIKIIPTKKSSNSRRPFFDLQQSYLNFIRAKS